MRGNHKFDVIVIGSGIGGSAVSALLSSWGFKVALFEKNHRIGGSCSYYVKDGFQVDWGTHMFSRGPKGPLGEVLKLSSSRHEIKFVKRSKLSVAKGLGINDLIMPGEKWKLPKFFADLFIKLKIPLKEYPNVIKLFYDLATMSDEEILLWDDKTVEDFVSHYTSDARVIGYLSFLFGLYFVLPPWEVSAGEAILCYRNMFMDWWLSYPKGGAVSVPLSYVRTAEDNGAKVFTSAKVEKILIEGGKVRGVYVNGIGSVEARAVISTTSLFDTVYHLCGEEYFDEKYLERIKEVKRAGIAVQAKIALKRRVTDAGCIIGGVSFGKSRNILEFGMEDIRRTYITLMNGKIPKVVPIYSPVPTNFDPTLAPPGCQLITACMAAPNADVELKDEPQKWNRTLLKAMIKLIPEIKDNIIWVDFISVKGAESWLGKTGAPAISTGQTPGQVGRKRHPVKYPVKGLYCAGDCGGGRGIGTELAAQSAIECAIEVSRDLNQERSKRGNLSL